MLTGALAVSYHGRPRTTLDIDIVLALGRKDLGKLAKAMMEAHIVVSEMKLKRTWLSDDRIVTLKGEKSPHTVDIMFTDQMLKRVRALVYGIPTYYEAADSLVLAKLRMLRVTTNPDRAANDRQDIKQILATARVNVRSL